jgi:Fe-S-cluster containining protein
MDIHFECTMCGKCCHNLKLPMSMEEAIIWAERGGSVQILCEAVPWPEEPAPDNLQAQSKRRRSFLATSGKLPTRIVVILAASFEGACPHLQADSSCGIYEERPRVCRIYPAEINPFVQLQPEGKACPPEAWAPTQPLLMRGHRLVNAEIATLIEESRAADANDAEAKGRLCASLEISTAAMANEGFTVYSPPRGRLLPELRRALQPASHNETLDDSLPAWKFVSNRREIVTMLASAGALGTFMSPGRTAEFEYLGFFPDSP